MMISIIHPSRSLRLFEPERTASLLGGEAAILEGSR